MNRTVYTVTSGALAALTRLDTVAQNLANVHTAGYKAARLVFEVRPLEASQPGPAAAETAGTAAQVAQLATIRDFSQGPVRTTGNPLDVGLTGPGFFAVATARGERYTRQGSFALDREGYLVTQTGERVQGESGDLRASGGAVEIADDGSVLVDGVPAGRLKVVDFGEQPRLVPEGNALFAPAAGAAPVPVEATAVRLQAGALEGANVDAVTGLVELVEVARGFESYMQAMQRLDEVAQRSITDVGRVG